MLVLCHQTNFVSRERTMIISSALHNCHVRRPTEHYIFPTFRCCTPTYLSRLGSTLWPSNVPYCTLLYFSHSSLPCAYPTLFNSTLLHYWTLPYTMLCLPTHSFALRSATFHYTPLHDTALRYSAPDLHYITFKIAHIAL